MKLIKNKITPHESHNIILSPCASHINLVKIIKTIGKTFLNILIILTLTSSTLLLLACSFDLNKTENEIINGKDATTNPPDLPDASENINDTSNPADNTTRGNDLENTETENTNINSNQTSDGIAGEIKNTGNINDISTQRYYFQLGVKSFEDKQYVQAQYYLEKIKDNYLILADHVQYYIAKSMLLQEKYDLALQNYQYLINNFKDSIFREKAFIEIADTSYLKGDFIKAEESYNNFINNFPQSGFLSYGLFQLGVCKEKNNKLDEAYDIYKNIYINYPESNYSSLSLDNLNRLEKAKGLDKFEPLPQELYTRGEKLFKIYYYDKALSDFNTILGTKGIESKYPDIYSKTLFKTGMAYFNMNDYNNSKKYLEENYNKFPSGSLADDCLYYLGRSLTNLEKNDEAIQIYKKLLEIFPSSHYADDSLYRCGRIFYIKDDFQSAAPYYQRVINEYPEGDRIADAYWELGWIQYRLGDYENAINTFEGMFNNFKGTSLEEKSLFWKAKSLEKVQRKEEAISNYKKIYDLNPLSYYGFKSAGAIENLGESVNKIKINKDLNPKNPSISSVIPEIYDNLKPKNDLSLSEINHINKAKELLLINFFDSASAEINSAKEEMEANPLKILEISTLYLKSKDYANSVLIIQQNYKKLSVDLKDKTKDYYYYLFYPSAYEEQVNKYGSTYNIEPNFILAIIREESRFKADAGSHAGAQGLMQIMPATGKNIAKQIGISNFSTTMLHDPEINIKMGVYYIRQMLDNFNQNKYYALGAYNSGPGAMQKWIARYGSLDTDEFIESLTYDETKNYIKKVIESYYIYNLLY